MFHVSCLLWYKLCVIINNSGHYYQLTRIVCCVENRGRDKFKGIFVFVWNCFGIENYLFSGEYKMICCCSFTNVMCFILSLSCGWMTLLVNCKQMWTDICHTLYSGQTWEDTSERRSVVDPTYSSFSVDLWSVLLRVYIWKEERKEGKKKERKWVLRHCHFVSAIQCMWIHEQGRHVSRSVCFWHFSRLFYAWICSSSCQIIHVDTRFKKTALGWIKKN